MRERTLGLPFDDGGNGKPIILLHGLPFVGSWDDIASVLSLRWYVVRPQLRGHGAAAKMPGPYDLATHAADVVALLEAVAIERAVVVGHSFGGLVGLEMLRTAPDRLAALILVATPIAADDAPARQARLDVAQSLEEQPSLSASDGLLGLLFPPYVFRERRDLLERWGATLEAARPRMVAEALRSVADRADARSLVKSSRLPVGAIVGALDETLDPTTLASDLDGNVIVLPSVGHMTPVEAPGETARAIEELLARSPTVF